MGDTETPLHDEVPDCELDDEDDELLTGYCNTCGGRGWFVFCVDDMCHGGDYCIHGDGEGPCPDCDNDPMF